MKRHLAMLGLVAALLCVGIARLPAQQYPMLDRVADKVVQKYQTSSCGQLAAERGHPPAGERAQGEERFVRMLHQDPQMRREFLNRVAAPIANKLFECGMIP